MLSAYDNILGKLNGKTDAELGIEKEEKAAIGRKMYTMQRYGTTHFVKGGYLVGDRIEKTKPKILEEGHLGQDSSEYQSPDRTQGEQGSRVSAIQPDVQNKETTKAQRRADRKAEKRSRNEVNPTLDHSKQLASEGRGTDADKEGKASKLERRRRKEEKRKRREEKGRKKESKASKKGA